MRSVIRSLGLVGALASLLAFTACGGKSSSSTTTTTTTTPNTITVTPTNASVQPGRPFAMTAVMTDSNNNVVGGQTFTFTSSNTSLLSLGNRGLVPSCTSGNSASVCACPGTWDSVTNPVVCTPATSFGTVTVTATSGSITSSPVTVFVRPHVDLVQVVPPPSTCVSQSQTRQFSARAFSNGVDVTSQVGPVAWSSTETRVVTFDSTGLATAAAPGQALVFATVGAFSGTNDGGVNSASVPFTTCPVASISLHTQNATATSFTMNVADNQGIAADVFDSNGFALPAATIGFTQTQPVVISVTGNAALTGNVTGLVVGGSGVVASCVAPDCNIGMTQPIYSNPVSVQVNGTANTTTVFAASTTGTSLIPIDTSNNTAGTALTLPQTPNSVVMPPIGTRAYFGSAGGLMQFDTTANTSSVIATQATGTVRAVSINGARVLVTDTGSALVFDATANTLQGVPLGSITGGDFTIDASKGFVVSGNTLGIYTPGSSFRTAALISPANAVAFLPQSSYAYVAGGAPNAVTVRSTCDNSQQGVIPTPGTPTLIQALPNGSAVLAVDSPGLDVISVTISGSGCIPARNESLRRVSLGVGSFTARQLLISSDSKRAFILSDLPVVIVYDTVAGTASSIPIAGGATALSGGLTLDGTQVWIGGSDNKVHKLDVASLTDTAQVSVSFRPDLVLVRPK